jgi:hypothetical protein
MSLTAPLRAAADDAWDLYPMWAGQGAPLASEAPAADLVKRTVADAQRVLGELAG